MIGHCLGKESPLLLHLLLIGQTYDGCLQGINFLIEAIVEPINSFVHGAFYIFYSLVQWSINNFLLLYKLPTTLLKFMIACSTGDEVGSDYC